jgi:hypothetical protein
MSNKMNPIEDSGVSKNYSLGYEEDIGDWEVEVLFIWDHRKQWMD